MFMSDNFYKMINLMSQTSLLYILGKEVEICKGNSDPQIGGHWPDIYFNTFSRQWIEQWLAQEKLEPDKMDNKMHEQDQARKTNTPVTCRRKGTALEYENRKKL